MSSFIQSIAYVGSPQNHALNECYKHRSIFCEPSLLSCCQHIQLFYMFEISPPPAPMDIVVFFYSIFFVSLKVGIKRSPPFDFFCRGVWEKSLVSQNGHRPALYPLGQASKTTDINEWRRNSTSTPVLFETEVQNWLIEHAVHQKSLTAFSFPGVWVSQTIVATLTGCPQDVTSKEAQCSSHSSPLVDEWLLLLLWLCGVRGFQMFSRFSTSWLISSFQSYLISRGSDCS